MWNGFNGYVSLHLFEETRRGCVEVDGMVNEGCLVWLGDFQRTKFLNWSKLAEIGEFRGFRSNGVAREGRRVGHSKISYKEALFWFNK